jgi:Cys-rich protein (TIGR01571 family)
MSYEQQTKQDNEQETVDMSEINIKEPLVTENIPEAKDITVQHTILIDEHNSVPKPNPKLWNGGLCDCFNNMYPSMLCSFCFPIAYTALVYKHITHEPFGFSKIFITYVTLNLGAYISYPYYKILGTILYYSSIIYILYIATYSRNILRKKNNIPGSNCEDSFVTIFCTPCSLAQVGRTLYKHDKICDSI